MRALLRTQLALALVALAALTAARSLAQSGSASDAAPIDRLEATTEDEQRRGATEEITVRGGRPLRDYRIELEEARQEIIEIYNQANASDDRDVRCKNEAPTGTRMRQRVCRSAAQNEADAMVASQFLNALVSTAGNFLSPPGLPVPLSGGPQINALTGTAEARTDGAIKTERSRAEIDEELRELQRENRRLYRAVVRYLELEEEYERARQDAE